jgi:hypothetical protein
MRPEDDHRNMQMLGWLIVLASIAPLAMMFLPW